MPSTMMPNRMPVEDGPATPSSDYQAMADYWQMVRAIMAGLPGLMDCAETYLPKHLEEGFEVYTDRLRNARLTNVFAKVVSDLSLRPFAKPMTLTDDTDPKLAELADDVDLRGNNLQEFSEGLFRSALTDGVTWIVVDQMQGIPGRISVADERRLGVRPFWRQYKADDVVAVYSDFVGGKERLTELRLREREVKRTQWEEKEVNYVRVFRLKDSKPEWERWRKMDNQEAAASKEKWALDEGPYPLELDHIPAIPVMFGRRKGQTWQVEPPLQDAAYLQIELYREENNLKHIADLTAFPMLAANGMEPMRGKNGEPVKATVGPNTVLYGGRGLGDQGAGSWAYIEPSGTSLRFLEDRIERDLKHLQELGRQPLQEAAPNLTVVSAASSAESSKNAVAAWVSMLEDGLKQAMTVTGEWMNMPDAAFGVDIHKDFDIGLGDQDVPNLITMAREKLISREAFLAEAMRRGLLSANFDADADLVKLIEEIEERMDRMPVMGGGNDDPNNGGGDDAA